MSTRGSTVHRRGDKGSYSPLVGKLYKSRRVILDILKKRGFDTVNYEGFSVNEVNTMYVAKQLKLFPPLDLLQIAETVN